MEIISITPENINIVHSSIRKLIGDRSFIDIWKFPHINSNDPIPSVESNIPHSTTMVCTEVDSNRIVISPNLFPNNIFVGDKISFVNGKMVQFITGHVKIFIPKKPEGVDAH